MIGVLWAYEGWHMLSFAAGEVKNPSRVLPRSYLVGTLVVIAVYLGANLAYLHVLPLPALAEHQRVAAKTMEVLAGPRGATFVAALILCSIFGAINGTVLGGPRAYFAMARDGVLFPSVGRVHPRYATPAAALLIQGGWSILLASTGTYKQLYTYVIFTGWLFYAAATFAVVILRRKRPDIERPYRVWGYPVVPIAFSAAALTIVANALVRSPKESGIGLILVLTGVPIFLIWKRKAKAATASIMKSESLRTWLEAYGRAWETRDPEAVRRLFAEDATYQETPFTQPMRGPDAIQQYWSQVVATAQEHIRFGYEVLAVAEDSAIVHWWASFVRVQSRAQVSLDGIFLLTFDTEGRCRELREWWVRKERKDE